MGLEMRGKPVADALAARVRAEVERWQLHGVQPKLAVVYVEGDAASLCYARAKARQAARLGIELVLRALPDHATTCRVVSEIEQLNQDPQVHGILVELPLPKHIDEAAVVEAIAPWKDVDGLTPANQWANLSGLPGLYPVTPQACVALLHHYGYSLAGKNVALVGCGRTVGRPLLHLLLRENATVTVCHAGTRDVAAHLRHADLALVAVGKAHLIQPDWVHSELVVVDAGINELPDGSIAGDVSPAAAARVAAYTPTPGGVGPVTSVQVFVNLMQAVAWQARSGDPARRAAPAPASTRLATLHA
ncbi:MAG: bifunctional 5,10-methylenetetrahydrofolate dehydrogenase/5,10-methenyltetrahydrofolate cyclohydrolase [Alicyclobacillus sp.]|nr:bifunctional 5,10-methylenetetrahydrofolate dehydrogenase/5,10-methenyltetrahydrofolate cyclohydrolase [Alicyclobacillus sp.]